MTPEGLAEFIFSSVVGRAFSSGLLALEKSRAQGAAAIRYQTCKLA